MPGWRLRSPSALVARIESLTAALRALGHLAVQFRRQGRGRIGADEARALGLAARSAWVREIVLQVDGVDLVAARSVLAPAALRGAWRAVAGLRQRPLGELLFADGRVRRSPLAFQVVRGRVHARHSVFFRAGRGLLVTEQFLPAFWQRAGDSGDRERLPARHRLVVASRAGRRG
ncbi:MAG: Chorismate pyruvate-lyase [Paracidovorax wautersii]|uniref:Probable chorismate pyruvate-lyase n=1 Tax=Paracidovorax wautersii TaxID=1177982 RepID=A0A7V8FKV1_9BURK|nr:MAG: Chorismate pyruvate-lyase [Paracidovorax wautersii]